MAYMISWLLLFLLAVSAWSATRPITAEEAFSLQDIVDVQVSPDGRTILFPVVTTELSANRTVTHLMRIAANGGAPAKMEGALEGARNVRWSPDGSRIAFFARRDGKDALWVLTADTAALTRVCGYDRGNGFLSKSANALAWSPDGTALAFAGSVEPSPAVQDPLVIRRILYKTRTSFSDNRRTHVFTIAASGGSPRLLTPGDDDEHSIDWARGGDIIFLSNHEPDSDAKFNYDLFVVNPGSGVVRQITNTPGVEMDPVASPDGASIAYVATKRRLTTKPR